MARLEAEVTANIGPFERALNQATEKAREFAEKTKDVGKDVFKEVGAAPLFNLAGLAGGAAAVTAFAGAIKESLEAFGHMETQVLRLKYNLKDPSVATEVHEWIESMALSADESEKLHAAFISLSESGLALKDIKPVLEDMQAVAFKSGESVDSIAEAFRRAKAGGLDAGEGATKLLKTIPGLANEINKYKEQAAKKLEMEAIWAGPARLQEIRERQKEIRAMTPADFVKTGGLTTGLLEQLIHKLAPREMMAEARGTLEGAEGRLSVVLDNLKESFGEGLAPAMKDFINTLNENLPSIEKDLTEFGTAIGNVVKFIQPLLGLGPQTGLQKAGIAEEEWENRIFAGIWKGLTGQTIGGEPGKQPIAGNLRDLANKEEQRKTNDVLEEINKTLAQVFS